MPTIRIKGPPDRLIGRPTGVAIGRDFTSPPPHIWLNSGPSPAETRKLEAYKPVSVSESEMGVLGDAGILFDVVAEGG